MAVRVVDPYGPIARERGEPDLTVQHWDTIEPSDRQRTVRLVVNEQPNATIAYAVDLGGTLAIGIRIVPYCGGAYPESAQVDLDLPPWPGKIELHTCFVDPGSPCPTDLP